MPQVHPGYPASFMYDYFIKDHLGNVMTADVTTSGEEYMATHELASASVEMLAWERIAEVRDDSPPFNNAPTGAGTKSAALDGADPDKRIGTAILLQAMAGDRFRLSTWAAYDPDDETANDNVSADPTDMLASLIGALSGGAGGFEGGTTPEDGGSTADLLGGLLNEQNMSDIYEGIKNGVTDPSHPRAYLNWIVFDENMQIVGEKSGAAQVDPLESGGKWGLIDPFALEPLMIDRNGYVLVYISDEQHRKVFFDNVTVEHFRGRLLEENHYYPFGLTLRTVAPGGLATREKYQGKELQEELGLELYDFHARQYDPQIGRFWGIDPMDQFPSGYTGMGNDPANMIDPTGMSARSGMYLNGSFADIDNDAMGEGFGSINGLSVRQSHDILTADLQEEYLEFKMQADQGMTGWESAQGVNPDIYYVNDKHQILGITRTSGSDQIFEVGNDNSVTEIIGLMAPSNIVVLPNGTSCELIDLLNDQDQLGMYLYFKDHNLNGVGTWDNVSKTAGQFSYPRVDRQGIAQITTINIATAMCYPSPRNNFAIPTPGPGFSAPPTATTAAPVAGAPPVQYQFSPNISYTSYIDGPRAWRIDASGNRALLIERRYNITAITTAAGALINTTSPAYKPFRPNSYAPSIRLLPP